MFLIMGVYPGEKKLDFAQNIVCPCCGRYGRIEVYLTYMYFSLFFLPVFRWNKRYIVRTSCCGGSCEIDGALGEGIAKGRITRLSPESLHFPQGDALKRCPSCGFATGEDFQFCPKCGRPF